ncbi:MAG: carboxypeptidase regulatory-like domain-containing protein, partial [Lentimicrobium sp.]|nr:carboxypeptidase regulatory-like domain-containing protein [Lentimicrobium sp.]
MLKKLTFQRWLMALTLGVFLWSGFTASAQTGVQIVNPNLDLGYRPINAWKKAANFEIVNVPGKGIATLTASEIDDASGFFTLENPVLPYVLAEGASVNVGLTTGTGVANGTVLNGTYALVYTGIDRALETGTYTATAYTPVAGNVWENAPTLPVNAPFPVNISSVPFYSVYELPGSVVDGKNLVYKVTIPTDRLFSIAPTTSVDPKWALYASDFNGFGGPDVANVLVSGSSSLANYPLYAGTYYLVLSTTGDGFHFSVDASTVMPSPVAAFNPVPADGAMGINNGMSLGWTFGDYTDEYRLILGTTYPPSNVLIDWTGNLATSYVLAGLQPNMQYFWKVDSRNTSGTTMGEVWGFTTTIDVPTGLTATVLDLGPTTPTVSVNLAWTANSNRAFLGYNVYRNGTKLNATLLTGTTYADLGVARNTTYTYNVTAVYDEGESAFSANAVVTTKGVGIVNGTVTDQLASTPVAGASVFVTGPAGTYNLTTSATGTYSAQVYAGTYGYTVSKAGYNNATASGVVVAHAATVTQNFQLMEFAFPVDFVIATQLSDAQVHLEWGFDVANFVPQYYPFNTDGMSSEEIAKNWNAFIEMNGITSSGNSTGDRELVEYQIYREKVYQPGSAELIGVTAQNQFIDFDWGLQNWGVYRWNVVAVYTTQFSTPTSSNKLDKDMETVVDVTVTLNSNQSPAGTVVGFANISEPELELTFGATLGAAGTFEWNNFRKGTYDITVSLAGYGTLTETAVNIFDATSFAWLLEEILAVPTDLYVTPTGFATWSAGSAITVGFEPYFADFESDNGGWVSGAISGTDQWQWGVPAQTNINRAFSGTKVWMTGLNANYAANSNMYLMREFDFSNAVNPMISVQLFLQTENNWDGMILESSVDGGATWVLVDSPGFYNGSPVTYGALANLPKWTNRTIFNYQYFEGSLASLAGEPSAWLRFRFASDGSVQYEGVAIDDISVTDGTTTAKSRELLSFKVFHDGLLVAETTNTQYQYGTNGETLVDGETYLAEVAAIYSTGQSAKASYTWTYVACDNYASPLNFTAVQVAGTVNVDLNWTLPAPNATDPIDFARITRNGEVIAEVEGVTYTDLDLEFGTYNYCITFVHESGAETCPGTVCASVNVIGGGFVNGNVKEAAYLGGANIQGAEVTLTNTANSALVFTFTTNAAGNYTGEVLAGTYDYLVEASGYVSQTLAGVYVAQTATVTNNFVLMEYPYPVGNIVATEISDNVVQVDWSGTGGGGGSIAEWLYYDDGVNVDGIGGPAVFSWAIKFDPAQLTPYAGTSLTKISIYNRTSNVNTLQIFEGTNAQTLIHEQQLTGLPIEDWAEVTLTAPVLLDVTKELWITVYTTAGTVYPAGCGATTNQPNGDLITLDGVLWEHLSGYGLPYTWNLRGFVTDMLTNRTVELTNVQNTAGYKSYPESTTFEASGVVNTSANARVDVYAHEADSRALTGYSVYRTTCATGDLQFLGFTLDEQFTDNTWGAVEPGVYKWGVIAEYDQNSSEVRFSNCLDKDMITQVSVTVITNSQDSPEGTEVTFTNTSEPALGLVYEVELDATGYYAWDEFRKGTYDILVEKNGFAPISHTGFVIAGPEAFEFVLEELLVPVSDLYVTPTGFATWRDGGIIPFEPFMENFNAGLPDTWTIVNGGSTSDTWFNTPNYNGNSLDGTPFMFANSDAAGSSSTMNEQLISPVINGENADELYLMFDYIYQYIGNEYFSVDVYDGANWVEVFRKAADSGPFPWGPTVNEVIDITAYANEALQVRFNYVSNSWNWYVAVDNVVVTDNMDRYANRTLENYKVWLDGVFMTDTENTYYQYNTENLVAGQDYLAEVAAVYSTGMSAKMSYVWTYYPCETFAGPVQVTGE